MQDAVWGVPGSAAMVATGHPAAAAAASKMLQSGGSAVDAAIAADAVMGVVEPMATSIGGDLLAMLVPPDGNARCYNGTGRAPIAMDPVLLSQFPGEQLPERHALTVTTPGAVRGWHDLHRAYGRLPWATLFGPAIGLAANGYPLGAVAAREWALFDFVLGKDPTSAALYRAGNPPKAGEKVVNTELAGVLRGIAEEGPEYFYLGRPAQEAAEAVQVAGGVLDIEDFAVHTGNFQEPLRAGFRGLTVLECPPNTHGMSVLEALSELDRQDLDPQDPRSTVSMVAAMERGMELAKKVVADPAGNTVCTVVVDAGGFAITLMSSIFKRFGSGLSVPGCGFVLQNRGFGFSRPGHVNGPGPGKRPYHTVVPGAALRNGRFHAGFGVVGGAMQPQGQLQLMVRTAAWGEALQAALDAPRWRLEAAKALAIEAGTPPAIEQALRAAGYAEPRKGAGELGGRSDFGGAQCVMRMPDGSLRGASDRRKDGCALAVEPAGQPLFTH